MRVSDGLWSRATEHPGDTALVTGDRRWTYGELQRRIAELGCALARRGLARGDRVGIWLPNSAEFLIGFLAAARYGWVAVPIPPGAAAGERSAIVASVRPALVLAAERAANGSGAAVLSGAALLPGGGPGPGADAAPLLPDGEPGPGPGCEPALAEADDPFYIGLTSGSTGQPKGVVRRHAAWALSFAAATGAFGLTPATRFLVPGPLHFSASLFAALHVLEIGGTLYLESRPTPRRTHSLIQRERITAAFMVPTLYGSLLAGGGGEAEAPLDSVRCLISCGEKLQPGLRAALARRFPAARIYEYYGSSEVGFTTLLPPEFPPDPACVGVPFPGVTLCVRRPDGTPATPGEVGALYARSPLAAAGYDQGGALLPLAGPDGWIYTGDLACLDETGCCFLAGRADDAINAGGATLFPAEIEAVLATHPGVAEVVVFGRPHPERGEEIVAAVVPKAGSQLRKGDLRAMCAAALASFKRPREFIFLAELPRTQSGKLSRRSVLQWLETHRLNSHS